MTRLTEIEERASAACEQHEEQGEFRAPVGIRWYAEDVPYLVGRVRELEAALERVGTLDRRIRECVNTRDFNGVRPLIDAYLAASPSSDGAA